MSFALPIPVTILIWFALLALLTPWLGYGVHRALERYCYVPYARRFCLARGLQPVSWRCGLAYRAGMKTEYAIVELHCRDRNGAEHLVELLVWLFGVKAVLSMP